MRFKRSWVRIPPARATRFSACAKATGLRIIRFEDDSPLPKMPSRKNSSPVAAPVPAARSEQWRRVRGYAFDPGLSQQFETAGINEIIFRVPWESQLKPGPEGDYVVVVDYDPASDAFYEPVDLNKPFLLGADGLDPDEGNPQFHQQFVYAVVMTTIRNFEKALGRRVLWTLRDEEQPA